MTATSPATENDAVPLPQEFRPNMWLLLVPLVFLIGFCALPVWMMVGLLSHNEFSASMIPALIFMSLFIGLPGAMLGWIAFQLVSWIAIGPRVVLVDPIGLSKGRKGRTRQLFRWEDMTFWHREMSGESRSKSWHFRTNAGSFKVRQFQVSQPSPALFELAVETASGRPCKGDTLG